MRHRVYTPALCRVRGERLQQVCAENQQQPPGAPGLQSHWTGTPQDWAGAADCQQTSELAVGRLAAEC